MKRLALAFTFLLSPFVGAEEYKPVPVDGVDMECSLEKDPQEWAYCIHRVPTSKNQNVVYYFHARNGNETWWNDSTYHTGKLYETWNELGKDAPTVISISFGKLWLLTEDSNHLRGGLFNIFNENVVPFLESKVRDKHGERFVAGISMGGLNSLMVSMKSKGSFTKAASMCAPLAAVSPHDRIVNIIRYYIESSTSLKRAFMLWKFSKQFYPTQEVWEKNDPIFLSNSFDPKGSPSIYISCGAKDDWGCQRGSEIFAKNIEQAGGTIELILRPGGHCDIDYTSLAKFLN